MAVAAYLKISAFLLLTFLKALAIDFYLYYPSKPSVACFDKVALFRYVIIFFNN